MDCAFVEMFADNVLFKLSITVVVSFDKSSISVDNSALISDISRDNSLEV